MGIRATRDYDRKGRVYFFDEHGREAAACVADALLAEAHAESLRKILASRPIPGGLTTGPRHIRRLEVSAQTFDRLAHRDREYAARLDAYAAEHAEWLARRRT